MPLPLDNGSFSIPPKPTEGALMTDNDIPVFPITEVAIGPVPRMGIVVMRLDFVSTAMQTPEEAQTGRTYAMSPVQVRDVIQRLQNSLATLENALPPDGGGPVH
jgi:BssS protein family